MSKSYFQHKTGEQHRVHITLVEPQPGQTGLLVYTNTDNGLVIERPPEERTYFLPVGRSVTVVIED